MMLTGSEIICECLIEQGVDTVFGYPGGTILNVYDALYRYQDKINHVLTSHEQGAAHAADGYARATGKVGVCMATSGPGATNLVTGIATAYMDSTPLVAITANVGVEILGRDSFQEIDITGVTMPITKHNFIVKDIKDLVPTIRKAFYIPKEGRPGPVLVDVTKNVTAEKMEFEPLQPKAIEPKTETYTVEDLDQAIEIIKESEKPFIFAGGGVISSGASQELKEFAEKIDVDAAEINKNIQVDLGIIGDAKCILNELNNKLERQNHPQWLKQIRDLKDRYPLNYDDSTLTGPYVLEQIDYLTDSNAIICTDVGQHQMWAAQYYHYRRPRQLITSGGAGTMGFGLGAAIGAKYGNPDFPVFNIAGDGCFRMNMNELATASRYNVPIIQVVINNKVLGMVRQWQTLFYGKRYSNTILDDKVDFCKVAEGLGCKAIRVSTKEEVAPAIKEALDTNGPVLIEVMIGKDDKVFPMVAPGGAISKAFDESDLKNK